MTAGAETAVWGGDDAAGGTFALRFAEGSEAISVERTKMDKGALRWRGVDAAGATVWPAPRCFLAAETEVEADAETVDRLAVVRDLVEGADFEVGADAGPASAADTELSPVSASATPVAGT